MNQQEEYVLSLLPSELSASVVKTAALNGGAVNEIRLRLNKALVITVNGKNIDGITKCTREHIEATVRNLCGNSMYSHFHTIRDGYIDAGNGIRAGICGQAVTENGRISAIKNISSVVIRIPRRVKNAAEPILELIRKKNYNTSILIYSKPGVGKTTVLREIAVELSRGINARRVAVVDTRSELSVDLRDAWMLDVLLGYPRSSGIETAVRTLSPQYLICDEIVTEDDVEAIISASGSGVHLCASIHADSLASLQRKSVVQKLNRYGVFDSFVGLIPSDEQDVRYRFVINEREG